jgi:hypothetical protein
MSVSITCRLNDEMLLTALMSSRQPITDAMAVPFEHADEVFVGRRDDRP